MTAGDGTVTPGNFPAALLGALNLPTGQAWQDVINAWVQLEGGYSGTSSGGAAVNNPLNANCEWEGQTGCVTLSNGAKVGSYANLQDAVASYASGGGINNFSEWSKASSPSTLADLITASNWSKSHYSRQTATINRAAAPPVALTGIAAYLFNNNAGGNANTYNNNYTILGGNANIQPGDTVGSAVHTAGQAAQAAANTASTAVGTAETLTQLIADIEANPMLYLVYAVLLLVGLAMILIGIKGLLPSGTSKQLNKLTDALGGLAGAAATNWKGVSNVPNFVPQSTPEAIVNEAPAQGPEFSPETPREPTRAEHRHSERGIGGRFTIGQKHARRIIGAGEGRGYVGEPA